MKLSDCFNVDDFRKLAKKNLPSPIFHYIDGGADDEVTLQRNTSSFDSCDLIPSVLTDVSKVDLSTTVLGQKIDFPLFLSPTAMHQMYHHEGEAATARAAEKFGTFLVSQPWQQQVLKKYRPFQVDQKCFNCIFIKIRG